MGSMKFHQPDHKFAVEFARFGGSGSRKWFAFRHTRAKARAAWTAVPHTNAILVGDVAEALGLLLSNYSNLELSEMLGLHPTPITKLRRFLGVEIGRGRPKE